jgi:cytochrome P450
LLLLLLLLLLLFVIVAVVDRDLSSPRFGPRICLGMRMAMVDLEASIMLFVRNFQFTTVPGHAPYAKVAITLCARDGIKLIAKKRKT